jgi:UDP-N-acetyl-D-galactosamine dehydrogenase
MLDHEKTKIAVIGLGYVGLPLAVEFSHKFPVVGFDISRRRIEQLASGLDVTLEMSEDELKEAETIVYSDNVSDIADCNTYIVTVPTPIDRAKRPDLTPLRKASETVGKVLKRGDIVIYESTVFPGCTRNECVPILEQLSRLVHNRDFYTGYSPERINPGDKLHRLPMIKKVTSGSTPEIAEHVDKLYGAIITAGTFKATSIEVAEAAKVIENTQRDINIALMNEIAIIFHKLGIDTREVLDAANTKWNFLPFRPGLVGGHCIGVDPYYITHRAQEVGYHPEVILAGRRINDGMGKYVAEEVVKLMLRGGFPVVNSRILIMGLSFKEDCPDLRNSRVVDVIAELQSYNATVEVHDPCVDGEEAREEYGVTMLNGTPESAAYDAVVIAVGHRVYKDMGVEIIRAFGKPGAVLYDIKGIFERQDSDGRL